MPGPYSFSMIKDSIGLIRAECHSSKWSRVLKTSKGPSSHQNRQTDKVWVASIEIAAGHFYEQTLQEGFNRLTANTKKRGKKITCHWDKSKKND